MADKEKVALDVNLLPSSDLEGRPGGRFIAWALSWGKRIVILTELVVVLAFLTRFKLDSDIANLSDDIERKRAIIVASKDTETKFRAVSNKLQQIEKIENNVSPVTIMDKTIALIPSEVVVPQVFVDGHQVSFSGTGDDATLDQMVKAFTNSNDFQSVNLNKVAKEQGSLGVNFALTAVFVGGQ